MNKTILKTAKIAMLLLSIFLTSREIRSQSNALDFDGANDLVSVSNLSNSLMGSTPTTIEFWAKAPLQGIGFPICIGTAEVAVRFHSNTHVQLEHFGGPTYDMGAVNDGCWHHYAFTWNGTAVFGYVDGQAAPNPSAVATFPATSGATLFLGVYSAQYFYTGALDEVRIWNVQRTQSEIQATLYSELVGNEAGLLAYYKFNQGSAGGSNPTETTLVDSQTNTTAHDGTLTGFALDGATSNWITSGAMMLYPEVNVTGNGSNIVDGSTSPSFTNSTDFAYVANGYTVTRTYTIHNTGSAPLSVTGITATGGDASMFTFGALTPASPIPAAGSASFTVTYTPTGTGLKSTTIHIANSDCNEADYDFTLRGNTGPNIVLDFGGVPNGVIDNYYNGGAGPNYGITFNPGVAASNALSENSNPTINFPAGFTTSFSVVGSVCIGFRIRVFDGVDGSGTQLGTADYVGGPGATLSITFCGTAKSVRLERFSCPIAGYDDLTFGPAPVPVPEIDARGNLVTIADGDNSPSLTDHTDFGTIANNSSFARIFKIHNTGTSSLTISSITSSNAKFVVSGVPTAVAAGDSATFTVTFSPTTLGAQSATITINNNDCDESVFDFVVTGASLTPGAALALDGSDDYVNLGTSAFEFVGSFTIETWVNATFGSSSNPSLAGRIMDKGVAGGEGPTFDLYNGIRYISGDGGSGITFMTAPTLVPANTWSHIAVTIDVANLVGKIYYNGALVKTQALLGDVNANPTYNLLLGATDGGGPASNFYSGKLDEFRVWNRALCQDEIQAQMNCELTGSESGLMIYYNFNQGLAGGSNGVISTAVDLATGSGHGGTNNGTLTNFALSGSSSNWTAPGGVTSGVNCSAFVAPEVSVKGGSPLINIVDGDITPTTGDGTDYGKVAVSDNLARLFKIFNTGSAALTISSVVSSNSLFVVSGAPSTVAAGDSASFTVTFSPTALGVQTATITINSNDCDEAVYDFAVTGKGATPASALHFDGVNNNVSIPNTAALQLDQFTLETWFNPSTSANFPSPPSALIAKGAAGNPDYFLCPMFNARKILAGFWAGATAVTVVSNTDLAQNTWYHLATTFDGTTLKLYVNGVLENSTNAGGLHPQVTTKALSLGLTNSAQYVNGSLDDVRIWNIARTCDQIAQLRNCELTGSESGLVAYYNFNQGFANENNSGVTTLTDAAGGDNNGTLNNFALSGTTSNWIAPGGVITGTNCPSVITFPEINVQGGAPLVSILDGDGMPSLADSTDFGPVVVNASAARTFVIQNLGADTITVSSITSSNTKFVVTGAPTSIAGNSSANFTITFSPTATGAQNATITINNNDCDEAVYDFAVTGNGTCLAPSITCPMNQSVNTATGNCSAVSNYSISFTGDPAPVITYAFSGATIDSGSGSGTGSTFNKGTTTITLTATNTCGAPTCTFTVTVTDNQKPTITCAPAVTINTTTDQCTGTTTLTLPTYGDNCAGTLGNALNYGGSSDVVAPITGLPTGNSARTVEFWVKITNTSQQHIISWGNFTCAIYPFSGVMRPHLWGSFNDVSSTALSVPLNTWTHVAYVLTGTQLIFYVNGVPDAKTYTHNTGITGNLSVGTFLGGTGQTVDEVRIWNVARSQAQIQANLGTELVGNESGLVSYYKFNQGTAGGNNAGVTTLNATTGQNATLTGFGLNGSTSNWVAGLTYPTLTNNALSTYPKGTTTVTWTTTDAAGNSETCQQTVTVIDNQLPVLTAPSNQTLSTITGTCAANYTISDPIADNCTGSTWTYTLSGATIFGPSSAIADGVGSGAVSFNKGVTTVTLSGVDAATNTAVQKTFMVTVNDNIAPTITCSGPVMVNNTPGQCTGTASLVAPTAIDNCPDVTTTGNAIHCDGINDYLETSQLSLGTNNFTIEFWVKQTSPGNYPVLFGQDEGNVTVPQFRLEVTNGSNALLFAMADANYSVAYNSTSALALNTWTHVTVVRSGNIYTTYLNGVASGSATASGNINQSSNTFNFRIGARRAFVTGAAENPFAGTFDDFRVWNFAKTGTQILSAMTNELVGNESGLVRYYKFNQGIAAGNNAGLTTAIATTGGNATLVNFALTGATSNWVGGKATNVSATTITNNALVNYPKGLTTVTWTATDASGNTQTCQQTVTVTDNEVPVLTAPGNQTLATITGTCAANYTISDPITDNCTGSTWTYTLTGATTFGPSSAIADGVGSGIVSFNKGVTTVTLNGVDTATNAAVQKTFTVTVADNEKPQITCTGNITQNTNTGTCSATVLVPVPSATDNCNQLDVTNGLNFDGANDYVSVPSGPYTSYTIETWVKFTGTSTLSQSIIYFTNGNVANFSQEILTDNAGHFQHYLWDGSARYVTGTTVAALNTWYHVAIVATNSGLMRLYVNGVEEGTPTSLGTMQVGADQLVFGKASIGLSYFKGTLDEVRVWTQVRTQTQIQNNMNMELVGNESGLYRYFRFNEGIANGDNTALTSVLATTGVNGTPVNMALNGSISNFVPGKIAIPVAIATTNSFNGTSNASGNYPKGTTTVTWTATDASGNTQTCTQTVTVTDNEAPVVTAPTTVTVDCGTTPPGANNYTSFVNLGGTANDNCTAGNNLIISYTDGPLNGNSCGATIIRTYTVTDESNNSKTATQTITVSPAALPTMTAPGAITVACGSIPAPSTIAFSNNLSGGCLISGTSNPSTFSTTPGACGGTVTETWSATDNCGRTLASVSRLITVSPAALPTMTAPNAITVACGSIPAPSTIAFTNNLSGGCQISGTSNPSTFSTTPGACGGTVTETWTATDNCGRTLASVSRVITVSPAALPTMTALGAITVACGSIPAPSMIAFSNNLVGGCQISGTSNPSTFTTTPGACGGTVTETWTATDNCGRTLASVSRLITVSPAALPTMIAPGAITVACGSIPAPSTIAFSNNLGGGCLISGTSNPSTFSTTPDACGGTVTETWTATDNCGRTLASVSRLITVSPAALPTMTAPNAITVACGGIPAPSTLAFSNNLSGGCLITGTSNPSTFSTTPGACGGTVTETWTATDNCGRTLASVSRVITVSPAALPTMTAPNAITVACGSIPAPSTIAFTNNLSGGCLISGTSNPSTFSTTPGACGGTVTETWTATDNCGRTIASVSRLITVSPAALPTMTAPNAITVACGSIPAPSTLSFTNGLSGGCQISGTSNPSTFSTTPGACGGTVTETWTATDNCGRTLASVSRLITVSPAALPTMTAPNAITVACGSIPAPSTIAFSNNLSGGCLISGTSNPSTFSTTPGACGGTVTETWTATDNCGRTLASVSRMITVSPAALPTMTAPGAITVACGGIPAPSTISFTNGLSGGCLISGTSNPSTFSTTPGACGGTVTETWTATDNCGRTLASVSRLITVSPAALPTMTAPNAITVACGGIPAASTIAFSNNLSGGCQISGTSNPSTFSTTPGACGGTVTETWTATDNCGRTLASVSRVITVSPAALPTMTAPNAITVACGGIPAPSTIAFSNNLGGGCLISGTSNPSTFTTTPGACGGTVTETWTATDNCGRTLASVSRLITVSPAALPTMTAPNAITVACGGIPAPSTLAFSNNLSGGCLISGTSNPSTFSTTPGACGGTVTETWTATDNCGRTLASVSREITVSPAALPTMTAPNAITVACGSIPAPSTIAFSNNLAGGCLVSGTSNPSTFSTTPGACGGTVTETWTATDNCGRTLASVSRLITVSPAALPTMTAPNAITVACGGIPAPSTISFTNGLSGGCQISGTSNPSTFSTTPGACGGTVTETWTATDNCGRTLASVSRLITVSPAALPTMTAPNAITVACGSIPAPSTIAFTNNLSGGCLISGTSNPSTFSATPGACGGTVTETWSATDNCGRTLASVSRLITVNPAALPTMTAPNPITVACGSIPAPSTISFTNGLSGGCQISGTSNPSTFSTTPGACGGTVTETWTATDNCGRTLASVSRLITVSPAALPTMTAPNAITVACGGVPAPSTIAFTNNLSGGCQISGTSNPSTFSTTPGACGGTVTETWTATDNCGRTLVSVSRLITVSPAALPTMTAPNAITVACGSIPAPSTIAFSNNLSGGCLISGTSNPSTFSTTPGACGGTVTETWTATDNCGRTLVSVSRLITVSPAALPTMTAPNAITVACGSIPAPSTIAFSNNLSGGCLISGTSNPSTFSTTPGACGGTVIETWTAPADACGRTIAAVSRVITVSPAALPTMTPLQDITITCGTLLPTATTRPFSNGLGGNCMISGTSNLSTFSTITSGNCNGSVLETWTATDACGRPLASVSRTITIKDNIAPTAQCRNVSINLNSSGNGSTTATAVNNNSTDNCSGVQSLSLNKTSFNCTNFGPNTVILTVTDNCQNTATCSAIVTVNYTSAPVAKCRNAIVVLSAAGNGSITTAGINNGSTDVCSGNGLSYSLSKTAFNCSNLGPNVVTLTVTNVAGLSSTCTGTVTVRDITKPAAKCKNATYTVAPGGSVTVPASAINNVSTDACSNPPSLSLTPNTFTCANVGANTVTLSASDASNNIGTCTATVTIICGSGNAPQQAGSTGAFADYVELMDVFPNPASDQVVVRVATEDATDREVTIYDYAGKVMYRKTMNGGDRQMSINLVEHHLSSGVYMVSVRFADHIQTKQLVVYRD